MKFVMSIIVILIGINASAFDLSKFNTLPPKKTSRKNLVYNGSFNEGSKGWYITDTDNIKVLKNAGMNGSNGLQYVRKDKFSYVLVSSKIRNVQAGVRYKYGAAIRGKNCGRICIEVTKNGKYLYGSYGSRVCHGNWLRTEQTFITRGENPAECEYRIKLFIRKESTGTAHFDDVYFIADVPEWQIAQTYPSHQSISANGGTIELYSHFVGQFVPKQNGQKTKLSLLVEALRDKKVLAENLVLLNGNSIKVKLGQMSPGIATLKVTLLDIASKTIFGVKELPFNIYKQEKTPENACTIDSKGRAIINGKPFMPIGIYGHFFNKKDIKNLKDSNAFNCVMPYFILRDSPNITAAEQFMDRCNQADLKVIFDIVGVFRGEAANIRVNKRNKKAVNKLVGSIVNRFKKHPALLAWYTADETPIDYIKTLNSRRWIVNRLDRWHPVFAVYFQHTDFSRYLTSVDILGYDPYPVSPLNKPDSLKIVDKMAIAASRTGIANWAVPQLFNVGHYRDDAKSNLKIFRRDYRYPTEHEMLAIPILEAIYGAKGFVMYSYFDLKKGPEPDQFKRRWPEVCRVARKLKTLAPFILSDQNAIPVKINNKVGITRARCFKSNKGEYCLLVAGAKAESNAIIALPANLDKLKSTTGLTKNLGNGKYQFTGNNICCDILKLTK